MDVPRKFLRVMKWGAIGFAIPIVFLGVIFGLRIVFGDIHPMDREQAIARLMGTLLMPAFGCTFVFVLAAYASSISTPRVDLVRSTLIIAVVVVATKLGVTPHPRYKAVDLNVCETVIPIAAGLITCIVLAIINRWAKHAM